jgi:UDP-glucose 4-epimerase
MKKILVTGASGYIGSHTCLLLLENGYEVVAIDDFVNSSIESLKRVEKITNKKIKFHRVNLLNQNYLTDICRKEKNIDTVIHFAALKSVNESVEHPHMYYKNNITGTLNLIESMKVSKVKNIIFSSSATVYKASNAPVSELSALGPTNPYGRTKLMTEEILSDWANANDKNVTLLRYFNPVGAHVSGQIGEDPKYPANLLPFVQQVACGKRSKVMVFGDDYDTPDGTGVRDYIHVMDLAQAHVDAVAKMNGTKIYNVGTGTGYSVLEMIQAFRDISKKEIAYEIAPRRDGDIANVIATADLIKQELGWTATRNINDMITDAWNWQTKNPNGYEK